ncbi:RuBisCO large subunit C-terminal-like domain-containing protein [Pseudothauera rhizosphaerae]|uniref:Ribulose 1,5-bisphosphate carboxylase n=1 Tax=Pseudothauera rhizosphaerae TaxID=2565932 RepID=A0A4V3WAZ4_9RHOO|nr:RuBisCO large subunit C-terminal-like domain-containing protein [Pseudothauera rhizosphaerae]THF61241.1 ribulose 1,5-bisphosphate carboxylase [Pseudothauera rhizosphaerae]
MNRLQATYRIRASAADIERRAAALAVEQSVEMPAAAVRDARVLAEVVGRVEAIAQEDAEHFRVTLGLALETTGYEAGQLMNMLFGNCSLQPEVELLDVHMPDQALARFGGPRFGIAGLRMLVGATSRPLTCSALKPQGSPPEVLAALAGELAAGGIDIVKDDHGLADQAAAPFARRVEAVQRAIAAANRAGGHRCVYAPSLGGGPRRLREQMRIVREAGVGMVMLAPMASGLGALQELAEEGLPVLAHPALGGAARIAPQALIGKLFRLAGADAVIYPNHGGRFSYTPQTCRAIAEAASAPWGPLAPALPVPAGGMTPARVEEMVDFYGADVILLIGGALLEADDLRAAARAFVARVHAMGEGR